MKKPEEILVVVLINEYSRKELMCPPSEYCLPDGGTLVFDYQLEVMMKQGFRKFMLLSDKRNDEVAVYYQKYLKRGIEIEYRYTNRQKIGSPDVIFNQLRELQKDFILLAGNIFMDVDFGELFYFFIDENNHLEINLIDFVSKFYTYCSKIFIINSMDSYFTFRDYVIERFCQKKPAVFLDRDGVINEIVYNEDIEQMDSPFKKEDILLIDGSCDAVKRIREMGYRVFIVTNQPAAAKGKVTLGTLYCINQYLLEMLQPVEIDAVYMCPHYPVSGKFTKEEFLIKNCDCRKPEPGLLYKARELYAIDWSNSYMIGDSYTDVLAGRKAGVSTVFIGNYKCDVCNQLEGNKPDYICRNLLSFSELLLKQKI